MTLIAFGINHNTASVDVREAVAFAPSQLQQALLAIKQGVGAEGAAILSTCNRTELYVEAEDCDGPALLAWMAQFHNSDSQNLQHCHYVHVGPEAVRHMMTVASGLDSLVLGEPQILGQMKSAYAAAVDAGTMGSRLHTAFHKVFSVAKRVRSETAIGENPVSIAYAAVSLAQQIFSNLKQDTVLLIGAGETIELVARHLAEQGLKKIIVANRTLNNAVELARKFNGEAILLADIPDTLHQADIVISSTASQLPLLGKGTVETALKRRKHKPMFMVDIAVPRDIEAEVGDLDDVFLYTVDDLREVIDENKRSREKAAQIAQKIVEEGVSHFEQELASLGVVATVKAFRQTVEELRDIEVSKALRLIQNGSDPEEILATLARNLANKFMHKPTLHLRKASARGDVDLIHAAHRLFELEVIAEDSETSPSAIEPTKSENQ